MAATLWADITALHVTVMQFAKQGETERLLVQPMVTSASDPWSTFGWFTMYDWALGKREVYTFEGDAGTITTISPSHPFNQLAANPLEVPRSACVTTCGTSLSCHWDAIIFEWRDDAIQRARYCCSCVEWPRVSFLARQMSHFVTRAGVAQLWQPPRSSWVAIILLAFESTWVIHVLVDIGLPLMLQHATLYAPLSSVAGSLAVIVLDMACPIQPSMTIDPQCTVQALDRQIQCQSSLAATHAVSYFQAFKSCLWFWRTWTVYTRHDQKKYIQTQNHHLLVRISSQAYFCATWT
ncbi:Aste57867_7696 [Aphanomyces stellatus]|uniref:Aste57867_7696 protein n=1 Tax=Aphanomyces stellatus TaxID=120398 RepID=A0A485KIN6_9STRA|nr:hypothetical protein As57867_007667 [Aphanomyces stellatus]VFT84599.1 Aste57867_7696 [Aphanomyces stellatus]